MFADMSKVQDDEVGDGTTSVTVLAAELLRVNTYLSDSDFKVKHTLVPCCGGHVGLARSLSCQCCHFRRRNF